MSSRAGSASFSSTFFPELAGLPAGAPQFVVFLRRQPITARAGVKGHPVPDLLRPGLELAG